jgi:hypothetical protein
MPEATGKFNSLAAGRYMVARTPAMPCYATPLYSNAQHRSETGPFKIHGITPEYPARFTTFAFHFEVLRTRLDWNQSGTTSTHRPWVATGAFAWISAILDFFRSNGSSRMADKKD